ncbi:MAG: hypothetical protein ABIR79_08150 [Candidatus Binatia bacterium]
MRERRSTVAGCLGVLGLLGLIGMFVAGCGGGSGSTGLVTSEVEVIDHVRETGSCDEFEGAPYCASDSPNATAPGGQSVRIVGATPTAVRTPTPHFVTPTPAATDEPAPSSTPAGGPTPTAGSQPSGTLAPPTLARTSTPVRTRTATPVRTVTPTPLRTSGGSAGKPTATPATGGTVNAAVDGFDDGAACATAARAAGSEDRWQTAALVALDPSGGAVAFPLPAGVAAPYDLALLCFDDPPESLSDDLGTLTDADPTVVFVLPSA